MDGNIHGIPRRAFLAAVGGGVPLWAQCATTCKSTTSPKGWCTEEFQDLCVFRRGDGPTVVLMHEVNGLSPGCIGFGNVLAEGGFRVYMPLFFGRPEQDN